MQTIESPYGATAPVVDWRSAAPRWRDIPYLPGLDGLRAVAVVAVLLYHGGVSWATGGFLGVEVFFVISGYLITLLLVAEHERRGAISIPGFWRRRARRLLPALFALLGAVLFTWVLFVRDGLDTLKVEWLSALTYTTNWLLIAGENSYFTELDRPSPLKHLWSLAVEEQFYVVWPIVALLIIRAVRGEPRRAARIFVGGALVSYLLMQVLYEPGSDPSRVYYGTDTRASALLLGAALAVMWRPQTSERVESTFGLELAGLAGITGVIACLGHVGDQTELLYRAGFLLCSLATLATIAAVSRPTALSRLLGVAPLVWIGTRSYGLYLWHWPVYILTRPGVDLQSWDLGTNQVLALRLAITFALAELSYRCIERPVREGALADWMITLRGPPGPFVFHRRRVTVATVAVGAAVLLPATVVLALSRPELNEIEESLRVGEAFVEQQQRWITIPSTLAPPRDDPPGVAPIARPDTVDVRSATTVTPTPSRAPVTTSAGRAGSTSLAPGTVPPTVPAPTVPATTVPAIPRIPVFALGDSVMLGAAPELASVLGAGTFVDARVSRQFLEGIEIVRFLRASNQLGETVIVHLGNNGSIGPNRIAELMAELRDVDRVVFLTVRVPRGWEAPNNQLIVQEAAKYPNARLLDWRAISEGHGDWFYDDGYHLRPEGRRQYAFTVAAALHA